MPSCLLDTNVLLYLVNPIAPEHAAATGSVERILASGDRPVVAAQAIYEFWVVATRPAEANGLGWSVERASAAIGGLRGQFTVLPEPPEVVGLWLELVVAHDLKGKRIHDAHLLATMKANGVSHLLTFNASDFPAATGLQILTPLA